MTRTHGAPKHHATKAQFDRKEASIEGGDEASDTKRSERVPKMSGAESRSTYDVLILTANGERASAYTKEEELI